MNNLLDTFLNLTVFAFIGLLVWLYFKDLQAVFERYYNLVILSCLFLNLFYIVIFLVDPSRY